MTKTIASGMQARLRTAFQPNIFASVGANSAANTVPELPMPAMPNAVLWCWADKLFFLAKAKLAR